MWCTDANDLFGLYAAGKKGEWGIMVNLIVAKILMEYLEKNHHPYTAIIVTNERVEVVETVIAIPKTDMN